MKKNTAASSSLGKTTSYCSEYSPDLLFAIPRQEKREEIGLSSSLPFHGVDIWNAYEISWLSPKGKPCVAIAQITIPCDTTCLVESKSMKLYFNSFNQTKISSHKEVERIISRDLSAATQGAVVVDLVAPGQFDTFNCGEISGRCIDDLDIAIEEYTVEPEVLCSNAEEMVEETLYSNLLKSNCLVTGQPDWATVWIHYHGPRIDASSLLRYIVSFRQHNEFHEQCIERMFVDIIKQCHIEKLTVCGQYTRRGGVDINPFRSNFEENKSFIRTFRQ
jgi:7-cyano-7-deazaguanine reductase